ncbi:MAG: hypothetical protein RIS08_798 [Actinomycetota bacterium]|jgi:hypothetical protein
MSLPEQFRGHQDADGRISKLPAKHSKRVQLCLGMLECLDPGVEYTEKEVNEIFFKHLDDFALVRRTLVDMGLLERDRYGQSYKKVSDQVQVAN